MTPRLKHRIEWTTALAVAASLAGCAYNPPPREEGNVPGTAAQAETPPPPAKPYPSAAEAKTPGTTASVLGQPEGATTGMTKTQEIGKASTEESLATIPTQEKLSRTVMREIPSLKVCAEKADINRMDESNFKTLGFKDSEARKIVSYRDKHGNFKSVDGLKKAGISSKTLSRFKDRLAVASDIG